MLPLRKAVIQEKLEQFKTVCKENKIKITPQRLLIYEELISRQEHPSADMVYRRIKKNFPTVSFDTVNRTLLTFQEIGVADLIEGTGNPKRFDGNVQKHHHFQCVHCKKIIDIFYEPFNHLDIPAEVQERCHVQRATVRLEGLCEECQQKKN